MLQFLDKLKLYKNQALWQKFSVNVPFFSMSPLNVLFLKEVTKNVYENQYMRMEL